MKPITLKLSGLQSYREVQQIDFEDLTQMGLFGIFGPTGSGKSTLLDAITLALYGKVERAVNGTQGIMNHSEDSLFVSFTFELNSSAGPEQYRVERRFKRSNELSISNTISRFIEITADGDLVLADKLVEVTRCVEDKLGLKMDDFTRAVVLPQGKFAEFLSLKGTDRRQMLQRLFHLEQYGDQLGQKLSRRVKENESSLKTIEAEQQGLGNAGREALDQVKKHLEETIAHAETSRRRFKKMTQQSEQLSKIWEWQIERNYGQVQLKELASAESQIISLEDRLAKAKVAQQLMPLLIQWQESKREHEARITKFGELTLKAKESEESALRAIEVDDAAQIKLSSEEPKLRVRHDQLEQAVKLQQERDILRDECHQIDKKRVETTTQYTDLQATLVKEEELLIKGQKRQTELQEALKKLEVRSQDRDILGRAVQRRQMILSFEEQEHVMAKECSDQERKLAEISSRLVEFQQEQSAINVMNISFIANISLLVASVTEQEDRVKQAVLRLETEEEQLRKQLKQQESQALALTLASQLEEGHACPVCGSEHHPHPVGDHSLEFIGPAQSDSIRRLQERLRELTFTLRQLAHEGRTILESVEIEPVISQNSMVASTVEEAIEDGWAPQSFSVENWEKQLIQLEEEATLSSKAITTLRQEATGLKQRLDKIQQQHLKYTAETEALRSFYEQTKSKLVQVTAELTKLQQAWNQDFPGLPMAESELRFREMQEKDKEADAIKERLEVSIPFITSKTTSVQSIDQQMRELDKLLIQLHTQWNVKMEQLHEMDLKLISWIGEESAKELLSDCKQQLQYLQQAVEQSKQLRRTAEDAKHEVMKLLVMSQQAVESAFEHNEASTLRWQQQLEASPLSTSEEVERYCLQSEEEARYAEQVRWHREQEKEMTMKLRHLEEKLAGSSLTEEEWNDSSRLLDESRNEDEQAVQARARAERDLEDVEHRHTRWKQLEEMRVEKRAKGEQLSKLQSCLRGNAFVEYIAEEQLMQVSQDASQRLRFLTRQRYSLEVDSGGGFVIRDDMNGGIRRPVSTLSGGETFLTSLSLALALSAQIQLRGQYPLQFFFLDEGFGTLDPELLDMVITSLERLHSDHLSVGIISHVPELRARLPRKLVILPAEQAGGGSRIIKENM
ncbi:exonuclease SbcC [Paenibacillus sp. DS2015]|uniref:SbcC/MukB-like Walker B domain-containing protein n=1 Tax=Paenibacillus sp. DS2015 TaxID=3373917 RepID=UPI003D24408D